MSKNEKYFYIIGVLILGFLFFISTRNNIFEIEDNDIHNISIIINETDDSNWRVFKNGIEKASYEYNIDLNFVTMYTENNSEEQIRTIKKEIEGGAEAIIIYPVNGKKITEGINKLNIKIPIIFLKNTFVNETIKNYVNTDDKNIIEEFILQIINENKNKTALIISKNIKTEYSTERNLLIKKILEENNILLKEVLYNNKEQLNLILDEEENLMDNYFIIPLEETDLLFSSEYFSNKENINIYGFGFNNQIINYLDNQIIKSIIAPDYYIMGYISIEKAINSIRNVSQENYLVRSKIITNEEIFNKENQLILFPIQ